jgi:UDP-N-acetylglucosamine 2-epimerase
MKHAYFMIGNSSSGIVEAPMVPIPVINVGNRQKGRFLSANVLITDESLISIERAIRTIESEDYTISFKSIESYFGDGCSSSRIKEKIKFILS